jgi:solute carrier family 35, member F5
MILTVALIWVAASYLSTYIFNHLNAPFFLTYVSSGLFTTLLLGELFRGGRGSPAGSGGGSGSAATSASSLIGGNLSSGGAVDWAHAIRLAVWVGPVWFVAQGCYNASLRGTSVATSTVLASSSCVWTLLFSMYALREEVNVWKALAIGLTLFGSALTSLDSSAGHVVATADQQWWSVCLALVSAVAYGVYTVQIRYFAPVDHCVPMHVLFGCIGLVNLVILAPFVVILNVTGVEPLFALSLGLFGLMFIKGMFDNVLSDLLWAWSILLTSPTVATIGLSLTIPMSIVGDWFAYGVTPSPLLTAGAVLTVMGFVTIELANVHEEPPRTSTPAHSHHTHTPLAALQALPTSRKTTKVIIHEDDHDDDDGTLIV